MLDRGLQLSSSLNRSFTAQLFGHPSQIPRCDDEHPQKASAGPSQPSRNEAKRFSPSIQCLLGPQDIAHIRPPTCAHNLPIPPTEHITIALPTTTPWRCPGLLLHPLEPGLLARALHRPQAKDDEGPRALCHRRILAGHDGDLGRLRLAHVRPPPPYQREAVEGRRGYHQAATQGAEVQAVQAGGV